MSKIIKYLNLWGIFFKIGLFTIGGGYAMLPIVEKELVDKRALMDMDEVLECYTLAQSLPGVIASNTAGFVGYRIAGGLGAFFCVLGVIAPSIIIIAGIANVFQSMKEIVVVQKAFQGVRIVVLVLLMDAIKRMFEKSIKHPFEMLLVLFSFIAVFFDWLSPVGILIIGALAMNAFSWKEHRS